VRSGGSENLTGRYTYTGQESDGETGLMYYGARYYSAEIGRFVQPDSMLPDIYDPQQLNRYAYVRNNPLKYVDPSGNVIAAAAVLAAMGSIAVSAGIDFAADFAMQMAFDYYFNPDTESWGEAFENTDSWQSARSAYEGFIPIKSKKMMLLKALGTGALDAGINKWKGGSNYTAEQALQDFAVGTISDLTGQGFNHLISKYGMSGVSKGLAKMGFGTEEIISSFGHSKIANSIASGHAYTQHAGGFNVKRTQAQFANMITEIMDNPTESKVLRDGRKAYWHEGKQTVVIVDTKGGKGKDMGTAFKTSKRYYDNSLK
jgi:RHS repeat-associated protein